MLVRVFLLLCQNSSSLKKLLIERDSKSFGKMNSVRLTRLFSATPVLHGRYDPKIFAEPIADYETLKNDRFDPDDNRHFLYTKAPRSDQTPVFYRDHVVDKFVRVCLKEGAKDTAQKSIYRALELIKQRQYRINRNRKPDEPEVETNPFVIANKALKNCRPLMKLLNCTRGGVTYKVPFPIPEAEAEFRAMKMMREVCRLKAKGGDLKFADAVANEMLAAYKNEGQTIQTKQELHKLCDANRAFAHYRR
ncbi:Ribosomal-S7 domain-containing protein [Aphelenchoides bicaudatus]|nr:Ribosomal-S7 domain-containing protein [Aphelenchoides bicaudatus]